MLFSFTSLHLCIILQPPSLEFRVEYLAWPLDVCVFESGRSQSRGSWEAVCGAYYLCALLLVMCDQFSHLMFVYSSFHFSVSFTLIL